MPEWRRRRPRRSAQPRSCPAELVRRVGATWKPTTPWVRCRNAHGQGKRWLRARSTTPTPLVRCARGDGLGADRCGAFRLLRAVAAALCGVSVSAGGGAWRVGGTGAGVRRDHLRRRRLDSGAHARSRRATCGLADVAACPSHVRGAWPPLVRSAYRAAVRIAHGPVHDPDDARRHRRCARIVRHHDDRPSLLGRRTPQEAQHHVRSA